MLEGDEINAFHKSRISIALRDLRLYHKYVEQIFCVICKYVYKVDGLTQ